MSETGEGSTFLSGGVFGSTVSVRESQEGAYWFQTGEPRVERRVVRA